MSSAYAKLSRRRQLFVDAYVLCGVGTEAIVKAGYPGKRPDAAAARFLVNPDVQAAIAERTEQAIRKAGARHVRFVEEVCTLAYARLSGLRGEDGKPLGFDKLPAELLAAAEALEFEPDGKLKRIKLAKTAGLRMLGDLMKLFPQTVEVAGKNGGPIETKEVSDLEVARRVAFLLTQGVRAQAAAQPPSTPAG